MNAATVSGPRSSMAALIFLDGDESFAIAAPHENLRDVPRRHLGQLAARLRGARDRLAIHRQDHVALPENPDRGSVGIDVGDDGARAAVWQLEAPRHLRRQVAQAKAEAAAGFLIGLIALIAVVVSARPT